MANPTKMTTNKPATMAATTTQQSIDLDDYRSYTIAHSGVDAAAGASTGTIFFSVQKPGESAPTVTATYAAGDNKGFVQSGFSVVISPECDVLHYKAIAGSPVFQIIPAPAN